MQTAHRYPLLGMKIILDEEKIIKENETRERKFDINKMYSKIDEFAEKSGLVKIDKYTYHCKGNELDLSCIGTFVYVYLVGIAWFTKNVKVWQWLSEKEGDSDMISFLKEDNEGVWE